MIDAFLKGLAISLLLIISVGPVVFAIFKQSINNGLAGGFSFVAGVWLSDVIWVILSNLFSEIIIQQYQREIGLAGSVVLIAMGVYYLFFKKVHLKEDEDKIIITTKDHTKLVIAGFLINSLNPGVMFFWLGTATAVAARHTVNQRIVIFTTCILINTTVDVLKVLLAGKIRKKINEKVITMINKISGLILLGFGIALLAGVIYNTTIKH